MAAHTHGSPDRVSRVIRGGEVFRALTCGSCGSFYDLTPWPATVRKGVFVSPKSVKGSPAAEAAARKAVSDAIRPMEKSA